MHSDTFSLSQTYEKYFLIGAAISPYGLERNTALLKQHFSSVTCENHMKYSMVHPQRDVWKWDGADQIVAFAKENHKQIRLHAPVWHEQLPEWVVRDTDGFLQSRDHVLACIEEYIYNIGTRYGKDAYAWDVVNEAAADRIDDYNREKFGNIPYRNSDFFQACGIDYIAKAFHWAHKYAPNVQLILNDFNECDPYKRERICRLAQELLHRDVPLHGIGMQGHYNMDNPSFDELRRSIEAFAALGLRLQITEMDLDIYHNCELDLMPVINHVEQPIELTEELRARHNARYAALFGIFREYADVIDSVTTWGVADDWSWLQHPVMKNCPMLFSEAHEPKDCVLQMIREA